MTLTPGANVGSIVPQRIYLDDREGGDISLCMRPSALLERSATVRFEGAGAELFHFRERYVRPAEMIVHKLTTREIALLRESEATEVAAAIL